MLLLVFHLILLQWQVMEHAQQQIQVVRLAVLVLKHAQQTIRVITCLSRH